MCPPCQGHGVGQWPGNITHGRPSGGWNYIDPFNWITHRKDSRNALARFSGSNRSGLATNTFGRIKNSTLSGEDFLSSLINKHLYHLHGPSRTRFRRSDRSPMYSREKSGEYGGYRDYSDKKNRYVANRPSRSDARTPLRMSHSVGHLQSCGRSLGRTFREYAGGMDGGGNVPKQDDILPQKCAKVPKRQGQGKPLRERRGFWGWSRARYSARSATVEPTPRLES